MRRMLVLVVVGILLASLIAVGCAPKPAPTPTPTPAPSPSPSPAPKPTPAPSPSPSPTPAPTPSPTPAQPPKAITLNGQGHNPPTNEQYKSFARVSERATYLSNGRLVMKPNPAGAIVPAAKEFDGVNGGSVDYAMTAFAYWTDKFPAAGLFTFTVAGLSPYEQLLWHLQGGGKELAQEMVKDYKVILIPGFIGPQEIFLSTNKPLNSLADIKGLKIRTAGDDGVLFSRMGASVVSVPPGEVYESIKRGVIDAFQLSTPASDLSLAMNEVVKYIYLGSERQPSEYHAYLFNKDVWTKLPDDLKGLIEECTLAETNRFMALMTKLDPEALDKYRASGVQVATIPKDIEQEIIKQSDIFYKEKSASDPFFAKVYQSQRDFQKKIRGTWTRL